MEALGGEDDVELPVLVLMILPLGWTLAMTLKGCVLDCWSGRRFFGRVSQSLRLWPHAPFAAEFRASLREAAFRRNQRNVPMVDGSPWWRPRIRPPIGVGFSKARGRIRAAFRRYFGETASDEVETACLQVSPGNGSAPARPFRPKCSTRRGKSRLYLHTSPGIRLQEAAGGRRGGYSPSPAPSRNGEGAALHHPEFTMLEWYRAEEPYRAIMDDDWRSPGCGRGGGARRWPGAAGADPFAEPEYLTVAEAFGATPGSTSWRRATIGRAGLAPGACGSASGSRPTTTGRTCSRRSCRIASSRARAWPPDVSHRISGARGGAGAAEARRQPPSPNV